jgi:hypothetical protein
LFFSRAAELAILGTPDNFAVQGLAIVAIGGGRGAERYSRLGQERLRMIMQIVAALMLCEGIFFGLLAYVMFRKKSARLALCNRTWGEVIGVNEHSGGEAPTKHPVIRYKAMGGEDVTFESKFGRSNWQVKPGDRLEILVNRSDPTDAEVVSFMAQWAFPVIFAVISAGSIIGAPLVYLFLKS